MREALVGIIMTAGLVHFEKMFKQLFGIEDGMVGGLKGAALKSLAAAQGIKTAAKAVGDNTKKYKEAKRNKAKLTQQRDWLQREQNARKNLNVDPSTLQGLKNKRYQEAMEAKQKGDMDTYHTKMKEAAEASRQEKARKTSINELNAIKEEKKQAELRDLDTQIGQQSAAMSSARLATIMGPANLVAGAGFGIGLGQDVADAFVKGGYITAGLDHLAEKVGARGADYERSRQYDAAKEQGRENPDILRKTINISQNITNNVTSNYKETGEIISGNYNPSKRKAPAGHYAYKEAKDVDDI